MLPGEYVFVDEKKVFQYIGEKLLKSKKDKDYIELIIRKSQNMQINITKNKGND